MPQPRFKSLGVEKKGGRSIVSVFDRVTGQTLKVYRKGVRYRRWDARDLAVTNQSVQKVVRDALEGAEAA
jgi:hypothetical protein